MREPGRPLVGFFPHQDERLGAVAVVVFTGAADPDATQAVGLLALLEARLEAAGGPLGAVSAHLRSDGVELTLPVANAAEAASATRALAEALTRPVAAIDAGALARARAHLDLLHLRSKRTSAKSTLHARCRGEASTSGAAAPPTPTLEALENTRRASATLQRVTFGVVGGARAAEAARAALREGARWPSDPGAPSASLPRRDDPPSPALPQPAALTVRVALETRPGARASRAAEALGAASGPAARLTAREGGRLTSVAGVAHLGTGCIDLELSLPLDTPAERVARLVARIEAAARLAEGEAGDTWVPSADAGEAARQAALMASALASPGTPRPALPAYSSTSPERPLPAPARAESPRARAATGVQGGDAWVLLSAPCAATDESSADAGLAAVAMAAAASAPTSDGARLVPWITPRGVGLLAHGPPREGESAARQLTRLATLVGGAFAAPAPRRALSAARAQALAAASTDASRLLAAVGEGLLPGRLPLLMPGGHATALSRASDDALRQRAVALAEGPLQAAAIAPLPTEESERLVATALAPFGLGATTGDGAAACRSFAPPVSSPAHALVETPRDTEDAQVVLLYADERGLGAGALAGLAALVNAGGLAAELGDRASEVLAEVTPLARTHALIVRFRVKRGTLAGARDLAVAARAYLAHGVVSEAALAQAARVSQERATHAGPRALLAGLLAEPGPAPTPVAVTPLAPLTPPALKSAAQALFASGGLAGIAGRAQ